MNSKVCSGVEVNVLMPSVSGWVESRDGCEVVRG